LIISFERGQEPRAYLDFGQGKAKYALEQF
jgi:hypothetical protein